MNKKTSEQFLDALHAAHRHRHRMIVHIALPAAKAVSFARDVIDFTDAKDVLWVDQSLKDPVKILRARLGTEVGALVLNAYDGLNPNVLGICQGLIRAGGVFVLLTPPLDQWPEHPDPDYRRLQIDGEECIFSRYRFIERFSQHLLLAPIIRVTHDGIYFPPINEGQADPVDFSAQQALITRIQKVALGRARRPLVIEADRGRGKTAALGMAVAKVFQQNPDKEIGVCSISRAAVECLFTHAKKTLGGKTASLRYFSPDQLLVEKPHLDLLVVDEAAAIPVTILKALVLQYRRVIFSTTVHGYEGNGKGFLLRFQKILSALTPQWSKVQLVLPIRYASNDPLESLVNRFLLLDAEPSQIINREVEAAECRWVLQDELVENPALLEQIFGLLVCAHYQTSPDDLRFLMDFPGVRIGVVEAGSQLLAVSMLLDEGELNDHQCEQLLTQRRRFRGHLLPQQLRSSGFIEALKYRFWRIARIAVVETQRREGVGSELLAFIRQSAVAQSVDFVGTSFSLESERLIFWQKNGYQLVKLGSHKNNATGLFTGCMLDPLNERTSSVFQSWRVHYSRLLDYQLLTVNKSIQPEVVLCLFKKLLSEVNDFDTRLVRDYVDSRVGFEDAQYSLKKNIVCKLVQEHSQDEGVGIDVAISVLLLGQSIESVVERFSLSGRKQFELTLRDYFR